MKRASLIALLCLFAACSQKATITVENYAGPDVEVAMEGNIYVLDDGEAVTQEINIGRKFIFGPSGKTVLVEGVGFCKLPFAREVRVEDKDSRTVTLYEDAGTVTVCNYTGFDLPLFLSPCDAPTWGEPIDLIPPDVCAVWKVEVGCWDLKVGDDKELLLVEDIDVEACSIHSYNVTPTLTVLGAGTAAKGQGPVPERFARRARRVGYCAIGEEPKPGEGRESE